MVVVIFRSFVYIYSYVFHSGSAAIHTTYALITNCRMSTASLYRFHQASHRPHMWAWVSVAMCENSSSLLYSPTWMRIEVKKNTDAELWTTSVDGRTMGTPKSHAERVRLLHEKVRVTCCVCHIFPFCSFPSARKHINFYYFQLLDYFFLFWLWWVGCA